VRKKGERGKKKFLTKKKKKTVKKAIFSHREGEVAFVHDDGEGGGKKGGPWPSACGKKLGWTFASVHRFQGEKKLSTIWRGKKRERGDGMPLNGGKKRVRHPRIDNRTP